MNAKTVPYELRRCARHGLFQNSALLAAVVIPQLVYGLGSAIPNQDAEAIARGNAFIATADNPSAIFYNPAGIVQLEGTQLQFGAHNLAINPEFESLDGSQRRDAKSEIATVPQFYCTFSPTNHPFSYGVGLYAPFGLGVKWPTNTSFNTLALESRLSYITFNPVVAWKILPNLSVAAGPTINYAKVKLEQSIGLSPGDKFSFDGTGWAFGATAGLLWKPTEQWAVGIDYRSATTVDFDGTSHLKPYSPSQDTSADLNFPQSIGAGIAFKPTPHWNVETYAIWTDWNSLDKVKFKSASGNTPFALNWVSSIMTGVGASRYFDNHWYVSAGYFFSQHSTPNKQFTPLAPDTDLHVGSVGLGYKGTHWSYALAGQIITGPWRTINNSQANAISGQTADGKYKWFNQSVNFSVGYRF